jgi:lipopolysaccharide biosynthesis glycosyltransferase
MISETRPIAIATAVDAAYALPLAVMLHSLVAHRRPDAVLHIYVVDDGLSESDRAHIAQSLSPQVELQWITRPPLELADLPSWGRISRTTYHRLTIAEWLPVGMARVIWLDADLLVLGDVSDL